MENGLNTDVIYQGMTFHVQTEDLGVKNGYFQTLIFYRGKILESLRFGYSEMIGHHDFAHLLRQRIEEEHSKAVLLVQGGQINTKDLEPILESAPRADKKSGKIKIVAAASRFMKKAPKPASVFQTGQEEALIFNRMREGSLMSGLRLRWVPLLLSVSFIMLLGVIGFPRIEGGPSQEEEFSQLLSQGRQWIQTGDIEKAGSALNRAVVLFPNRSEGYVARAHLFREKGALTQAIEEMTRASEMDPGNGYIFFELGGLRSELGDDAEAIENFQKAVELDYRTPEIYESLGSAFFRSGNLGKAEQAWGESLEIHPDQPVLLNQLGLIAMRREAVGEAIRDFQAAIDMDPKFADAYVNLGDAYCVSGLRDKSRALWEEALRLNPDHPLARAKLQSLN